jgi:septum formation protein
MMQESTMTSCDPMPATPPPVLLLASASPRRRELLRQIGVSVEVCPADIDESVRAGEAPVDYVLRLARAKAEAVWSVAGGRLPVLAADTSVICGTDILGNPADCAGLVAMLQRLSSRTHEVLTAVALRTHGGLRTALSTSEVTFRALKREEIERYWETGEPADKAGGYAVQGIGAMFISRLQGSFSGVMGLPLYETAQLLQLAGVPTALVPAVETSR